MLSSHDKKKQFEKAYQQEADNIFGFLFVRLRDRERALELTQDAYMLAWMYMAKGNDIQAMRPFLFTTAYNLFKNELRSKHKTISLEKLIDDYAFEPKSLKKDQEQLLEVKMLISKIRLLPRPYQEVMNLRYVKGLPVKNIAKLLNESATTISVRIHRGIEKLRKEYHEKLTKKYS